MAREIVTSENLRQFVDKKIGKKPITKAEEVKPKTQPEKSRFFDKLKNEMGLINSTIQKKLDRLKNQFMSGKISEEEIKEELKLLTGSDKQEEEKQMPEKKESMNLLTDVANKKI